GQLSPAHGGAGAGRRRCRAAGCRTARAPRRRSRCRAARAPQPPRDRPGWPGRPARPERRRARRGAAEWRAAERRAHAAAASRSGWADRTRTDPGTGRRRRPGPAPGLELHHMGSRVSVFPRAAWAVRRGLAADADVVLEVVNGIVFLTPAWLRKPRVTLVHHVHQDHYVTELGRVGRVAGLVAEA